MNSTLVTLNQGEGFADTKESLGSLDRDVMLHYVSEEFLPSSEPVFNGLNRWTFNTVEPYAVRLVKALSLRHSSASFTCEVTDCGGDSVYSLCDGTGTLTKKITFDRERFPAIPSCEEVGFFYTVNPRSNVLVCVTAETGGVSVDITDEYLARREPERFPNEATFGDELDETFPALDAFLEIKV